MSRTIEATLEDGVLRLDDDTGHVEGQRVRVTVAPLNDESARRREALRRAREITAGMNFRSSGKHPTRDELHERR